MSVAQELQRWPDIDHRYSRNGDIGFSGKAITFDIDWAPDFMVVECLEICAKAGVPASFYATHESPVLAEIDQDPRFELGIHPNFLPGSSHGKNYADVLRYCLDLAPRATSMRTHSLYQNSRMFTVLGQVAPQISVDASLFLPGHENLHAVDYYLENGKALRRLPFYWEDDVFAGRPESNWEKEPVTTAGLNIFAFHPVHVSLNTDRFAIYDGLRAKFPLPSWTRELVQEHRNTKAGSRTYLQNLINGCKPDFKLITQLAGIA